jgi:thymidylate synthase (FAD)
MSQIKLVSITHGAGELVNKTAQEVISYITRVSNPNNQLNFATAAGLLKYCIKHNHWSPFEHAFMTLEINTTRDIGAQILRHRSFTFQEFSQRYADVSLLEFATPPQLRRQDTKNRQNSIDDIPPNIVAEYQTLIESHFERAQELYKRMINDGVAKESARKILPLETPTRIYMSGTIRSWIHYVQLRSANGTQLEHQKIAILCGKILEEHFPDISQALFEMNAEEAELRAMPEKVKSLEAEIVVLKARLRDAGLEA